MVVDGRVRTVSEEGVDVTSEGVGDEGCRRGRRHGRRASGCVVVVLMGFRVQTSPTHTSFAESDAAIHSMGSRCLRRGTRIARTTARMTRTSTISAALAQAFAPWRPETESAEQFFWVLETVPAQIQREYPLQRISVFIVTTSRTDDTTIRIIRVK